MSTFVDAFRFIGDNVGLLWDATVEHILLSGESILIAILIAVPIGMWLGHIHRGSFVAINVSNIGRALPSLAIIAICLAFIGLGNTITVVALVVLAVPPILTNAYVAVDAVEAEAVEAARGMGMTTWQVIRRVELPLALPLIFAGIRTATVFVVATATIAAIAGGGGLGDIIVNQASYRLAGVIGASLCVMALSALVFGVLRSVQLAVTPRALRATTVGQISPGKELR
jgi:osmoprotectant transport system permease protein